jgi:hypothetical protein
LRESLFEKEKLGEIVKLLKERLHDQILMVLVKIFVEERESEIQAGKASVASWRVGQNME